MRIAMARELVIGSRLDMETVAERTGFSSARQLRRVWNRLHETPPTRLRASFGPGLRREDDEPPGTRARLRAMRGG